MDETNTTVATVREVGPDAVAIDLETPAGFDARPGQFVKVSLDDEDARFYTISSPDVADTFEITVGIDPEGTLAPRLADLAAGDAVTVAGPFGRDHYEDEPRVVVLAGGPGVGPAVGIAERTLDDGGTAAVVYRDDEPIHRDRLDALADRGATVRLLAGDESLLDAVAGALETADEDDPDPQVFVYGFEEFVEAAIDAVAAAGGDPEAAKVENFG